MVKGVILNEAPQARSWRIPRKKCYFDVERNRMSVKNPSATRRDRYFLIFAAEEIFPWNLFNLVGFNNGVFVGEVQNFVVVAVIHELEAYKYYIAWGNRNQKSRAQSKEHRARVKSHYYKH